MFKRGRVYLKRSSLENYTSYNMTQHDTARDNTSTTQHNTRQHECNTTQHETTRVQHETTQVQHDTGRVQQGINFILVYLNHRYILRTWYIKAKALLMF